LIFGSLWTRVHFGKHWINDPKLLTTLILWVYYALVVHANLIRGLKPRQLSSLILFGGLLSLLNLLFVRHEI
ncbi:MAG: cytochrome c biogenesis protein CcsA, partial [Aquificaceae bacterium]